MPVSAEEGLTSRRPSHYTVCLFAPRSGIQEAADRERGRMTSHLFYDAQATAS